MLLSGKSIKEVLEDGSLKVEPEPIIKEAAIKIHLSDQFCIDGQDYQNLEQYQLNPQEFITALSLEKVILSPDYAALYDGYIGLARQGIFTHLSSMLVDPGFSGQITLEIFNAANKPVLLKPPMRVGHLMVVEVT